MKPLLACLLLSLGPGADFHNRDGQEATPPGGQEAETQEGPEAPGATELPDDVEWVRGFVRHWPSAKYTIWRGERELGTYTQGNKLIKLKGREILEFTDAVEIPGADGYRAQATHTLSIGLPTRSLQASTKIDGIKLAFSGGRMKGQALMKKPVDLEVPKRFLTDVDLLRGVPRVPALKGAEKVFPYVDLKALPNPAAVSEGTLRCQGQEPLELGGETVIAWKYRWHPVDARPTFFWYGERGELLQRLRRKELWKLQASDE